MTADRLGRISLWLLILGVLSLAGIPAGCAMVGVLPLDSAMPGLQALGRMAAVMCGGLILAGLFGLGSLVTGIAAARERRHVLIWTVPLWVLAGIGLAVVAFETVGFLGEATRLIPGGKQDDVGAVAVIWIVSSHLLALAYWLLGICGRRFRYLAWWSVPVWSAALSAAILLCM